jgi:putative transposase
MDVFSRKILKWRISNTIDAFYYAQLLKETIAEYGIQISMDGRNRCLDNIYLSRYAAVKELKKRLKSFISYYNTERAHQRLYDQTPDAVYESFQQNMQEYLAA